MLINLKNIILFGYHGCLSEEKKLGQKYELDVQLKIKNDVDLKLDDISKTVDYIIVYNLVKENFQKRSYNLIETAAMALSDSLLESLKIVEEVTVRIRKPHAPIEGHFSEIEVEITRIKNNE